MVKPANDPRAAGFDPVAFRSAIHFAMDMGTPNVASNRATFRWTTTHTYTQEDIADHPYSWGATPTSTTSHPDVQIPVAINFTARASAGMGDTEVGNFEMARAILTVLDTDYVLITGADKVLLGEAPYSVDFISPPIALFDVDVFEIYIIADDLFVDPYDGKSV